METETGLLEDSLELIEDCLESNAQRSADLRDIKLRKENNEIIKAIQGIILAEEDKVMSRDEVLSRILGFYGKYVPFRAYM